MAYSREKVDFTDAEHKAAEALDTIYEALADGVDVSVDLAAVFGPTVELYKHLKDAGSIEKFADMLIDLAVAVKRDNGWLSDAPADDVSAQDN